MQHRPQEWLKFLREMNEQVPADLALHLILDNYATHQHEKVKRWLKKHPRFHLHFTPTSASWMNLVERFLRDLTDEVVLPGSFGAVKELGDAIWVHLAERNLHPRRYIWKAKGHAILEKIQRARKALGTPSRC